MKLDIRYGLPFVSLRLIHENREESLTGVLVDTGSASTIISTDVAIKIGLGPSPEDKLYTVRGVGGREFVYEKVINKLSLGEISVDDLSIQIGAMEYGFDINGILGMDFLSEANAVIDLSREDIYLKSKG